MQRIQPSARQQWLSAISHRLFEKDREKLKTRLNHIAHKHARLAETKPSFIRHEKHWVAYDSTRIYAGRFPLHPDLVDEFEEFYKDYLHFKTQVKAPLENLIRQALNKAVHASDLKEYLPTSLMQFYPKSCLDQIHADGPAIKDAHLHFFKTKYAKEIQMLNEYVLLQLIT